MQPDREPTRRQTTPCHIDAKPGCCYAFRAILQWQRSTLLRAKTQTTSVVTPSTSPLLLCLANQICLAPPATTTSRVAEGTSHATRARLYYILTLPSETFVAAAAESPLRVACRYEKNPPETHAAAKKTLPRRVLHHGSRVWGCR